LVELLGRQGIGIMRKALFCAVIGFLLISPSTLLAATLLCDDFSGNMVSPGKWHIPTWVSPTDGTVVGLTQFRFTQSSPLPAVDNGNAIIAVESYNPTSFSFLGTDLRSNQSFVLEEGIHISNQAAQRIMMKSISNFSRIRPMEPKPTFTVTKS
jgi:hypothetical protein